MRCGWRHGTQDRQLAEAAARGLAEQGDQGASAELAQLADGQDEALRGLAMQERRRLTWTADPAVRMRLGRAKSRPVSA
jgi:hypothetical protein